MAPWRAFPTSVATGAPAESDWNGCGRRAGHRPRPWFDALMDALGYVVLYVRHLETSVAFYREVVELTFRLRESGYAEFGTRGTKFALFERARLPGLIGREAAEGGPGGEVVFLVDDADEEAQRLRGLGVEILAGPVDRPWGHRTLHLLDPDGFVVELAQEIPGERPRHD